MHMPFAASIQGVWVWPTDSWPAEQHDHAVCPHARTSWAAPHTCLGGGSGGAASCACCPCCPSGTPTTAGAPPAPAGVAGCCGSGGATGCCGGGMLGLTSICAQQGSRGWR